ncbi:MAG TPA: hypothetical protein DIU15_13960 [Deltaproteobacteria bacterium]|nr:hypothetical protein [Deltaproteobacteria bacterium]HCP47143.1 hypothetical protein [Deltaproteobacteria bacterium]
MKLLRILLVSAALSSASVSGVFAADPDPVMTALLEELARSEVELQKQDPSLYFMGLQVIETSLVSIQAEEGGLQGYRPIRRRAVHADIRLGEPRLDSSHLLRDGSWDSGSSGTALGIGDDVAVLRRTIWHEVDQAYRKARERMRRVQADQDILVDEEMGWDLAPVEPVQWEGPTTSLSGLDIAAVEDWLRRASLVFAESRLPMDPYVHFSGEAETRWFVSTEGHRTRHSLSRYRISVSADTVADDGMHLSVSETFDARSPEGLPQPEDLVATTRGLLAELEELRHSPLQGPYTGPAILSGRAGAVFFHEIFGHRVEGHRLRKVDDAQTFRRRVGEAILPFFLSVHDDPTLESVGETDLRGHYLFDDQGVPASRVTLVEKGVLKGFLESRSPALEDGRSNGHGRRQSGHDVVTRQGNLVVSSSRNASPGELRRRLLSMARAEGREFALIIDDIGGGFTFTDREIPNAFQIDVLLARRVYVDGRPDELVRGIDLIGTPLQTFSQIVAASDSNEVFNGTCGAESGWVPVSAVAPALLLRQVETQRKASGQMKPPLLEIPPARQSDETTLLSALSAAADRSLEELHIEGLPRPSWVVVSARDVDSRKVTADFGSVRDIAGKRSRPAHIEVVVGDLSQNSSRLGSGGDAPVPSGAQRASLVIDDLASPLDRDLWLTADASYKAGLQRLAIKEAARRATGGTPPPPDWTEIDPVVAVDDSVTPQVDSEVLKGIATATSARLRGLGLTVGSVTARSIQGQELLVNTLGSRIVKPFGYTAVSARASVVRPDGLQLQDSRQWVARSTSDLPSLQELEEQVAAMGRDLVARVDAPVVEHFEGPVIFEGEAAADVLRYLVPPSVRGTPPLPEAGRSFQKQTRGGPRLGRRLLPTGWSVMDNPMSAPAGVAGGFLYDQEGVPSRAVHLVDSGRVIDMVMSRVPRADLTQSNGHARGPLHNGLAGRLSLWQVTPNRNLSARAFEARASRLRRASGADRVLVVRRMQRGVEGSLPSPNAAVWRYADGREEPVLALEFLNSDRRNLRDIVAAGGGKQSHAYLGPLRPGGTPGLSSGLPMLVTAPRMLLVDGIEAVFPGADLEPHVLPPPPMDKLSCCD